MKKDKLWFKDAIIYELPVKSFKDSNGDGIGDFKGLLTKLDYLEELGVTAVWLLPFFPSPLRDDGYDIADYDKINPIYGDVEDFKLFVAEAHKRNIRVIIELVINHTSDQHAWFKRAKAAPEGSSHRNYYVWSDNNEKYKDVRIIFQDYEKSNWTWDDDVKAYYWHRFFHHQPDLNFDNPDVQEDIFKAMDFWASFGVDGFRLDAIPYLFEREGTSCENVQETHDFLKKLRAHMDSKFDDIMLLAEANMWPEDTVPYFGNGADECHMNFHFPVMPRLYMALKKETRQPIIDILNRTPDIPENCQWATFLRNHDELTLEMVTLENRHYMWENYAPNKRARINLGIRLRLARLMDNSRRRIELMNILLFSLPGTPVVYYGDEIGMGDNCWLEDRDGVRTPMQWDSSKNAGFSDADEDQLYLPVIKDAEFHYREVNVATQRGKENSLFEWTKKIIDIRKQYKVFGRGDLNFLQPQNEKILAFTRTFKNEKILTVVNLSKASQAVALDLSAYKGAQVTELFSGSTFPKIGTTPYPLTLNPWGYFWLKLE